ncbi:heavy metal translocating P-type ATPase [Lachnoclostridium phytofermentans]|uniref:Cd(2+)-exporting ATPase n=1 Tax=Lachnoclostridium phytofermentans (strain ATCC 700394 / DSM 18823 / ISDg) TaxID=357809 RepID=A9KR42_LACP7|nr:heavy metal translocating P-type ATPase [Lachnoclostridium phytofermentans]ABX40510.1 heavy metal translocating P-type ATPase [Lachnoclostridium phytofermentans ISDg]
MKKHKKNLIRIIISTAIFLLAILLPLPKIVTLILYIAAYLLIGYDVLWNAFRNVIRGHVLDENFLMSIATIGAFAIAKYDESIFVMLFYQVGELFQSYAVAQSRKSITALMDIRPDYANLVKDGEIQVVDPEEVMPGDHILIKPGEKIPLDGKIVVGQTSINTSALTGESLPRESSVGDEVISGCINLNGTIEVEVTKEFEESTVSKILELVESASDRKAKSEAFITKFAKYYTPTVVIFAVLLAVIPPIFVPGALFSDWLYRALIFLVVSCPCALVISIPLGFFGGIGGASKKGILIKGSNYLESLSKVTAIAFDKTGTLTKGNFVVHDIVTDSLSKDELLEVAALAESHSSHPIATSIREAFGKELSMDRIREVQEVAGFGISAIVDGKQVFAGNRKMMAEQNIEVKQLSENIPIGTTIHIAIDGNYAGYLEIRDEIKSTSKAAIEDLRHSGVHSLVMLTGDAKVVGEAIAKELNLDHAYTELLPADKVEKFEEMLAKRGEKDQLAFVGDGINDAPVLARADIGIAMGGLGSDAAIEAADVVIMDDDPEKLVTAIRIARKTLRIVKQNIIFALAVKGIILILGAAGLSNMWEAVFADVGVSVIAILNSIRALKE